MKFNEIETGAENPQSSSRHLYQGLGKVAPITVNPTNAELGKLLGTQIEKEIVYGNDEVMRLDIWVELVEVNKFIKIPIFISNDDVKSKAENYQWINAYGQTGWFKDKAAIETKNANATEEWQKMKMEGLRIAKKGEAVLYEFLMKAYNASSAKPFPVLESWKKLTQGNVKELKEVMDDLASKGRTLHVLLGVKDGKYQDVWTGMFLPAIFTAKSEAYFMKKASDVEYPFKSDWDGDLKFRQYNAEPAPSISEVEDDGFPWEDPTPAKLF